MKIFMLLFFLWFQVLFSQQITVSKIEPPNWWAGMKWDTLQLMLYGENLDGVTVSVTDSSLTPLQVHPGASGKYCFIDFALNHNIQPGTYIVQIKKNNNKTEIGYSILEKHETNNCFQGFSASDIIYLITPDRWVNGDVTNDRITGLRDQRDQNDLIGRHGGDIAGIIEKIPYLKDLGITSVWINPLLMNDMEISYHGYAATDLYNIDPRFGTNELYQKLVRVAHLNDIKVIMDHVSNHIGIYHPWVQDIPAINWFNGSVNNHLISTHDKQVLFDSHSDPRQIRQLREGWFVDVMPDLNQKNPFVSNYLIQNTLWWIEYAGLDGIREDTFPYVDPSYLARWRDAIYANYSDFSIVGEVWIHDPVFLASYQKGSRLSEGNPAVLESITDFGLFEAFGQVFFHRKGVTPFYSFLSRDFIYKDANQLLTFLDNHDVLRFMDVVKGDIPRYIMGLSVLLTTRGIPQIFYGTEIGLAGGGEDHGQIRAEFPGGFRHHKRNAFTESGRTDTENYIFKSIKKLINIRKSNDEFTDGDLLHFPPQKNIYVYFRRLRQNISMVIVNGNNFPVEYDITKYSAYIQGAGSAVNLLENYSVTLNRATKISLKPFEVQILKLKR